MTAITEQETVLFEQSGDLDVMELTSRIANKMIALDDYEEHPDNYNVHPDEQIEALMKSLSMFGQPESIVVWRKWVLSGNGVYRSAKQLGWTHMRADVLPDDYPEYLARAYLPAANELARLSHPDEMALANLLQEARETDVDLLEAIGYDSGSLDRLLRSIANDKEPDPVGEDPGEDVGELETLRQKWGVEFAQLWALGDHRIICGDCTDATTIIKLMNGERAVLFETDPPYLVDYDGTNHPHKWGEEEPDTKNKDWSEEYRDWDEAAAEENDGLYDGFVNIAVAHAITENAAWYCWHASRNQRMLENVWEDYGAFVHQQIIWMKDRPVLTRSWYMWQHEPCFYGWIRGKKPFRRADDYPSSVWQIPTTPPGEKTLHPTSKPPKLWEIPILQHTRPGELCYEPFSGSGTNIIAAERLSRRCYASERNPAFVALAIERWHQMTKKQPNLLEESPV